MALLRGLRELFAGIFQTKTSSLKEGGQAMGWILYGSSTHLVYWLVCYCNGFVYMYHISLAKRAEYQYWNTYSPRPVPVDDLEPVSVQGGLHEHAGFWIMNWKPLLLSRKVSGQL